MIPPKIYDNLLGNRSQVSDFISSKIVALENSVGVGEWEFIALVCLITFIIHVIKLTSDVTLSTLNAAKQNRLSEMQMYLKR